jgi:hypothetical protein
VRRVGIYNIEQRNVDVKEDWSIEYLCSYFKIEYTKISTDLKGARRSLSALTIDLSPFDE